MSRKSFQRVTLSVELTLPPGAKAQDALMFLRERIGDIGPSIPETVKHLDRMQGLRAEQAVIKILKRETIYTN